MAFFRKDEKHLTPEQLEKVNAETGKDIISASGFKDERELVKHLNEEEEDPPPPDK